MVAKETLTIDDLRKVFCYCPETGEIRYRTNVGTKVKAGDLAGYLNHGYVRIKHKGVSLGAHRLAWALLYGDWPKGSIDHINGDPADNRIVNLRDVDHRTNMENKHKPLSNNRIGVLGVRRQGSGFHARIRVDGKEISLGTHPTADAAHAAYLNAKRKMHKGCAI